ncbi:MAG: nicotinate-nucleotide--dimethylbenzimidazole phosphoribosyltransferase [Carboxydocellales bacterium]
MIDSYIVYRYHLTKEHYTVNASMEGRGMLLEQTLNQIKPLDKIAMDKAQQRLDNLTKPFGALGVLEEIAKQLAGITGNALPKITNKVVVVMAGDHGVVEEGVSACPKEVTYQMVANFINGGAGINVLARHEDVRVVVVDIGVEVDIDNPKVISKKVKRGTDNMAKGPAMSRAEAVKAIEVGIEVTTELIKQGVNLLATGEMGIGNTTPSSAILAAFGGFAPEEVTGRGTGISDETLKRKIQVITKALELNKPNKKDALDVLAKVGGLEIAGLVGVILGAAASRVPVVIDGFISSAAALVASRLKPEILSYIIASHASMEAGHKLMLEVLGLKPALHLEMRLGEGTGAVLGMGVVEAASKIINEMATFAEAGVAVQTE